MYTANKHLQKDGDKKAVRQTQEVIGLIDF